MKNSIFVLVTLLLIGCAGEDPLGVEPEDIDVRVSIVDELNRPFKPDRVWWYYGPGGREFEAVCINKGCTEFAVTDVLNATHIYVSARYSRSDPTRLLCAFIASDVERVEVAEERTVYLTIKLVERQTCL